MMALQGVLLPDSHVVNGTVLSINGSGVRSIHLFGIPFHIYVAGFYTFEPIRSPDQVLTSNGPMQLDFTFLRSVRQNKVKEAWERQLDASVSYHYEGYARDRESFLQMFGPIEQGGMERVQLIGDDTIVYDQGTHKGMIHGRDFQRAFLSMWFGERAVAADLKVGLLGGSKAWN